MNSFLQALIYHSKFVSKTSNMAKNRRIIISDESVNCYGTWIKTDGVDISQFERNPVMLWMHWRGCIIGCVKDIRREGDTITGEPFFDEVRDESKMAKKQWDAGTLKMCSGSFDVIEVSEAPELIKTGQYRAAVTKSKLTEVSMVDIGGNDNALPLKLNYKGTELNLATGDDNITLPLLNNNKKPKEKTMNANYTSAVAIKLGLTETATESDVLSKIELLQGYQVANIQLQKEKDEMTLSSITNMVDTAISKRLILADKKDHFVNLGKNVGCESLQATFDSMTPQGKPLDLINRNGSNTNQGSGGNYSKLSEVPADELMTLRNEDKTTYMRLYKAEYGVECPMY